MKKQCSHTVPLCRARVLYTGWVQMVWKLLFIALFLNFAMYVQFMLSSLFISPCLHTLYMYMYTYGVRPYPCDSCYQLMFKSSPQFHKLIVKALMVLGFLLCVAGCVVVVYITIVSCLENNSNISTQMSQQFSLLRTILKLQEFCLLPSACSSTYTCVHVHYMCISQHKVELLRYMHLDLEDIEWSAENGGLHDVKQLFCFQGTLLTRFTDMEIKQRVHLPLQLEPSRALSISICQRMPNLFPLL